ncbi:putative C2H2 finger domain protein [Sphaerosporella brunnea]|uniref:Putative C2H2 finger domain protein n=1 Tax=Sphaerosporella brunnea TaxID=1250544 RepID=A0A5J5F605_9PEZI|nr:putative C2H2 finger domain protein [Sphaerosporella brunnea]
MTKKKKRQNPEIDELLARPWCYYCERDFDDLKILIHHQKAKHFKCDRCARRLNTAGGLRVHMEQVHKETLEQVENALPGRESIDLEIFGTEGIPEADVAAHNQRIMAEYAQKEADRRAASGQSNGPKKPKLDISKELDPEEIKRKLEAHKKAMASGGALPVTPVPSSMSPGGSQSPGGFDSHGSPQVPPQVSYPQATSPPPFQPGQFAIPQPTAFSPVSGNSFTPTTYAPQPPNTYPTAPYSQPTYPQQPPAPFGRGGPQQPFSGYPQPPGGYAAPTFNGHNQFQQSAPAHLQPPRHPVPSLPLPHQIPGLPPKPSAPGLPPRPSFTNPPGGFGRGSMPGPPPGQWSPPVQQPMFNPVGSTPYGAPTQPAQPPQFLAGYAPSQHPPQQGYGAPQPSLTPANATPLGLQQVPALPDNLSKSQGPDPTQPPQEAAVEKEEPPTTAKQKRETKLLYGDNDVSPEEKRSTLSKYHFESSQVRIQV